MENDDVNVKESEMKLNEIHPVYGKCVMCRTIEGEPYRFFDDGDGCIAMIPLNALDS